MSVGPTKTFQHSTFNIQHFNIQHSAFNISTFNISTFQHSTFNISTFNISTFQHSTFNHPTTPHPNAAPFSCARHGTLWPNPIPPRTTATGRCTCRSNGRRWLWVIWCCHDAPLAARPAAGRGCRWTRKRRTRRTTRRRRTRKRNPRHARRDPHGEERWSCRAGFGLGEEVEVSVSQV